MTKKISSAADLKALKDKLTETIELRQSDKEMKVIVHMGTCGIAAGAREILTLMMAEIAGSRAKNVTLQQTGCVGLCHAEPMVTITDAQGGIFRYGKLDKTKAKEVFRQHIVRGTPMNEYLIKG